MAWITGAAPGNAHSAPVTPVATSRVAVAEPLHAKSERQSLAKSLGWRSSRRC